MKIVLQVLQRDDGTYRIDTPSKDDGFWKRECVEPNSIKEKYLKATIEDLKDFEEN